MKFNSLKRAFASVVMGAALPSMLFAGSAQAEEILKAVSAFPKPLAFTQSFLGYVDLVNERGKGVVQIQHIGGPEVFPSNQQVAAVERGIVDIHYGPAGYHLGSMPEADAWLGSTITAAEGRKNGGFALMEKAFKDRLGVKLMAHIDSGIKFHIYTIGEPQKRADGSVDLTGKRLRTSPVYKSFFEALDAIPVSAPVPDIYTGLERNVFDGAGWPIVAIQDLSWDKFLKYRVDPGFLQTDLSIVMSPAKWDSLSPEAQKILQDAAIEYEQKSYDQFQTIIAATDTKVQEDGMTIVRLEGKAADDYLDKAYDAVWNRMKASNSPLYDELKKAYYQR
ncbi:TRAP transporter substrate-binding protein DctP [Pseudovibrio sp. JE062]|uniref:TRAP transporter substrate-binding protein DctP n=1 Tax=Pseudovibrio sp. JE062 TaxID=439495 RepID=UPI000186C3A4|nr:TRAP transporter substrate-binding protein DctP [Pseudovibrio sp. JE062]EEA96625.1 trap dicarboxylate transporter- dctp subunit [Pseudovibrio sp. JE062]